MGNVQFITVSGAAKILGTTEKQVRKLCFSKQIPYYKPLGRLLFDPEELVEFVRAGKIYSNNELSEHAVAILNGGAACVGN